MKLEMTGRHVAVTPALKTFTREKLAKLGRWIDDLAEIHVILTVEKHRHIAEIVAHGRHVQLSAREVTADMYTSIVRPGSRKRRSRRSEGGARRRRQSSPRSGRRRRPGADGAPGFVNPGPRGDPASTGTVPRGSCAARPSRRSRCRWRRRLSR